MIHDLNQIIKKWSIKPKTQPLMDIGTFLDSIDNPFCHNLILSWKKGFIQSNDLYQHLGKALFRGDIDSKLAEKMLNLILVDGGYEIYPKLNNVQTSKIICFESYYFDLFSLNRSVLSYEGNEMEIYSHHGNKLILSRNEPSSHYVFSKSLNPPAHGCGLWWHHSKKGNQLIILPPASLMCDNKPILLIGESIIYEKGEISIDHIVNVDLLNELSDELLHFCLLVEGRYLSNHGLENIVKHDIDTKSEIADSDMSDKDEIVSDSGAATTNIMGLQHNNLMGDNHYFLKSSFSSTSSLLVKRKYYIIFAFAFNNIVHVDAIINVSDNLLTDQRPTNVLYMKRNAAVVYGTNGLLGIAQVSSLFTQNQDNSDRTTATNSTSTASNHTHTHTTTSNTHHNNNTSHNNNHITNNGSNIDNHNNQLDDGYFYSLTQDYESPLYQQCRIAIQWAC